MRTMLDVCGTVPRVLVAVVLLNSLVAALVWAGAPQRSLAVRAATVRLAPGRTLYLIVGPINTQVPPVPTLLDEYRLRRNSGRPLD